MVRLTGAPAPDRTGPDEEFYRADEKVWVPEVQVERHVPDTGHIGTWDAGIRAGGSGIQGNTEMRR